MELLKNGGPLPRELVTKKSLENACAAVAATGGSTNAALHIPAIAHEAGIRFSLDDLARVAKRTPHLADMKPGGRFLAKDLHKVGGVYAVLKELLKRGALHGDCLTIFGTTLGKRIEGASGGRRKGRSEKADLRRPAASWSSRAISRPTARCSRSRD